MKIAIVEDLQFDFETLREMLTSCLHEQKVDCELRWFQSGEAFLADFTAEQYDLLFLDMLLGEGMNGMDAARAVRAKGCRAPIVFTTSERDYAVEGYEVQATDYLIKPYQQERLAAVLARVLTAQRARRYLVVQTGRDTRRVCLDELAWAETQDHYTDLHLENGALLRSYQTFEKFAAELPPLPQFQCCCRGVIVNLEYVDSLQGSDFLLRNGQKVPVSRAKRAEMQRLLSDYILAKAREELGL